MNEIWYLMLPGTLPENAIPDLDFKDETVDQCDIPLVKNTCFRCH